MSEHEGLTYELHAEPGHAYLNIRVRSAWATEVFVQFMVDETRFDTVRIFRCLQSGGTEGVECLVDDMMNAYTIFNKNKDAMIKLVDDSLRDDFDDNEDFSERLMHVE